MKEVIVTDLLAGRAPLAEATEQFTVMNASRPEYMVVIRANVLSGATDHEKMGA